MSLREGGLLLETRFSDAEAGLAMAVSLLVDEFVVVVALSLASLTDAIVGTAGELVLLERASLILSESLRNWFGGGGTMVVYCVKLDRDISHF